MTDYCNEVIGLIPARGGSKSMPLKNIVSLNGTPLMAYVANTAKKCKSISQIICSTDNGQIADVSVNIGIEVMDRPKALAQDDTHIVDVMIDFIHSYEQKAKSFPFAIALLQPTSPFLLPEHIDHCVELLKNNLDACSVQTITTFPPNFHAYNQRVFENDYIQFRFPEERAVFYNKQRKPKFYIFGNLIITRTESLLEQKNVFANPSLAYEVPPHYALDVDGPEELETAEWYLQSGKVNLPPVD